MTSLTREKRYDFHAANLRATGHALEQIERLGKDALRRADEAATLTATRLYALLLAASLEVRLLKLLYEARVSETDRSKILAKGSQRDRWAEALDSGFRRVYGIAPPRALDTSLDETPRHRRSVLIDVLDADLRPLIELSNTLAHGQWQYAFTHEMDALSADSMKTLNTENLRGLQHKREIAKALANSVQDLLISASTFDRDFDSHFKEIERRRHQLTRDNFEGYVAFLRRRHARRHRYIR